MDRLQPVEALLRQQRAAVAEAGERGERVGGRLAADAPAGAGHALANRAFGTVYDISTFLILWFAGASAMAAMRGWPSTSSAISASRTDGRDTPPTTLAKRRPRTVANLAIDEESSQLAFVAERDSSAKSLQKFYKLWHWQNGTDSARLISLN